MLANKCESLDIEKLLEQNQTKSLLRHTAMFILNRHITFKKKLLKVEPLRNREKKDEFFGIIPNYSLLYYLVK